MVIAGTPMGFGRWARGAAILFFLVYGINFFYPQLPYEPLFEAVDALVLAVALILGK